MKTGKCFMDVIHILNLMHMLIEKKLALNDAQIEEKNTRNMFSLLSLKVEMKYKIVTKKKIDLMVFSSLVMVCAVKYL